MVTWHTRVGNANIPRADQFLLLAAILEEYETVLWVGLSEGLGQAECIFTDPGARVIDKSCVDPYMHDSGCPFALTPAVTPALDDEK